ncbi:MAG TPA: alpha/beta fold hydrolase [Actinospica sp.]|nr:alpha/beta fold hydrolase [Actinospica sp.]
MVRNGLRLAVFEHADAAAATESAESASAGSAAAPAAEPPVILFVHGYPDSHATWDEVLARLGPGVRTVRYDVRGAGASDAPRSLRGYRLDELADDLFAVADTVSPDRPVHLVAHDWGSIQSWHAATDPRAPRRIASFTSISGPCLDHTGYWFRERFRHPSPRRSAQLLRQGSKSWYIYAFHVPFAAPLLWRYWLAKAWPDLLRRTEGIEPGPRRPQPTLQRDAIRGIGLYRANMLPHLLRPEFRYAHIPVQLISPTRDRFVSPALADGLEHWAPDLRRHTLACGHWGALTRAAPELAERIMAFVDEVERAGTLPGDAGGDTGGDADEARSEGGDGDGGGGEAGPRG